MRRFRNLTCEEGEKRLISADWEKEDLTLFDTRVQKMEKIFALLVLFVFLELWMLVAWQGEATPVHISLKDRKLYAPTTKEDYGWQTSTYIVHMENNLTHASMNTLETTRLRYNHVLQTMKQDSTLDSNGESPTLPLHVYSSVCHGFSARLTPQEAAVLRQMNGVLAVYPDRIRSLQTTHTPEFLGLTSLGGLWPEGDFGDDVIVGVLDSGVWPERESFSDVGLGPIPARWKGICQTGTNFNTSHCNKKLIGARYYSAGYENATKVPLNETIESRSPRDTDGHGTHTASTAAGSLVHNASLFGLANGTARGMAPKARVAIYKACWAMGCVDSDILAGLDQAVADGVDVISISLGHNESIPYHEDSLAIGTFGAMKKGIFVSCAGGNFGPQLQTIFNTAPWMMSVAASTLDRAFPANVELGDGQIIHGQSLYHGNGLAENASQLIIGGDAALSNVTEAAKCLYGSLNPALVKEKIVVCQRGINARVEKGAVVLNAGGIGMILTNTIAEGEGLLADSHLLPAIHVGANAGRTILAYMNGTLNPVGKFQFLGMQYNVIPAPVVAAFSSRGPNPLTPEVLKPDITAPGVKILAAWTGSVGPSSLEFDTRRVTFNIISGTSMACPHISGLAALLKGAHPEWSPSAIKSAMMTTATIMDNVGGVITDEDTSTQASPLLYGAGHVRPEQALDPGLVYDMDPQDYVNFLCGSNYTAQSIQIFTHNETVICPKFAVRIEDMNYPSFSAVFKQSPSVLAISTNMTRTVTNVGNANATYLAQIIAPLGIQIIVQPEVLSFSAKNEKKNFTLQVTTVNTPNPALFNVSVIDFAFLVWRDGVHVVQSPISITVYK